MENSEVWWPNLKNNVSRISFNWDIWYTCNYRCSYCWWEQNNSWEELAKKNRILSPSQWGLIWDRIYEKYGSVRIDIVGGEPLLYPNFVEIIQRLAEKHFIFVNTNLSVSKKDIFKNSESLTPEHLAFAVSLHLEHASLEEIMDKIKLIQEHRLLNIVTLVAWPPFVPKIPDFRKFFSDNNIPLDIVVFEGLYNGKHYPRSYNAEERLKIGEGITEITDIKYRLLQESTRGKLCHSGRIYANIKGNGEVYRCGRSDQSMGNIIDGTFSLFNQATPCPYTSCLCREYQYLDDEISKSNGIPVSIG